MISSEWFSLMVQDRSKPDASNGCQAASASLIVTSHRRLVGQPLLQASADADVGIALYEAPFVVLAHDTAADPVFFYANRMAQELFEMTWDEMVRQPSRLSAEPLARTERERLLKRVAERGYVDDYSGIRVSKTGRRFRIERATVWNLVDANGACVGQAAAFGTWVPLGQT
jgi:hypothetical protein